MLFRSHAGANCVLIETPRRSMLKLIASIESVRKQIDETSLRRAVRVHIAPFVPVEDVVEMLKGAVVKTFTAGQTLFKEGDEADGFYLIRRGSVTVSRMVGAKEVVMAYVAAGNFVGEMALLSSDDKRTATVRATVNCETIVLSAKAFNEVVNRNPQLRNDIQALVRQQIGRAHV